jgi:hypothetical protein
MSSPRGRWPKPVGIPALCGCIQLQIEVIGESSQQQMQPNPRATNKTRRKSDRKDHNTWPWRADQAFKGRIPSSIGRVREAAGGHALRPTCRLHHLLPPVELPCRRIWVRGGRIRRRPLGWGSAPPRFCIARSVNRGAGHDSTRVARMGGASCWQREEDEVAASAAMELATAWGVERQHRIAEG